MKAQKLTTDLAVAAMLMGMAGLVVNIFGFWHYIYYAMSVAGPIADTEPEAKVRSVYVLMNLPLKVALIVCSIALLYRVAWGRWGMTVVGLISIAHSVVATVTLKTGIVGYWLRIGTPEEGPHPLVKQWDWVVLVLVLLFYGFTLWHLHRRGTREEFSLAAREPIEWTSGNDA